MARVDIVPNRLVRVQGGVVARERVEAKARRAERHAVAPGAAAELRAIPVVSRGTPGAISGTQPERALLAAERARRRVG